MFYFIGGLEQLSGSADICEDDVAEFVCSSDTGFVTWNIIVPDIRSTHFGFGRFFNTPRSWNGPGSSVLVANVSFNETLIVSTVIFHGAIHLNNTVLECDGNTITYVINASKKTCYNRWLCSASCCIRK